MQSPDFNALEVYPVEEFGCEMSMNGDEQQLGFDFTSLLSEGTDALYEAQKKLLGAEQQKLEAQAIKTGGEFVAETASDILSTPQVKALAKEQAEEAAIQKVATTVREGYTAVMTSPGKYFLYIAGGALALALALKFLRK